MRIHVCVCVVMRMHERVRFLRFTRTSIIADETSEFSQPRKHEERQSLNKRRTIGQDVKRENII